MMYEFPRRKTAAGASFLDRRYSGLRISRAPTFESGEDIRGRYGLNLLHEPSEALIDFIFVHGLRGGSRKTWSLSESKDHFWPKEWLPLEPKFKNVRIHSYGYNADWGERDGSQLTIRDFGQALLADIFNSPVLNASGHDHDTPMVFVAHSMGGLVVKTTLLLAKQNPLYSAIASRINSMFFLATPHRGADNAQLLKNILKINLVNTSKAYVSDLLPDSGTIQAINDEFRHVSHGIHLWSFFETVATNLGLIVDKSSAVLGLPGEQIQLLNADHRHVCKFNDSSDNNYCVLRNAFGSAIDRILQSLNTRRDQYHVQMRSLSKYLGGIERPEAALAIVLEKKQEGSCLWLTDKTSFEDWREDIVSSPRYYWLTGEPATGKSIIAGHVVDYLESGNSDTSYFFFRHGERSSSTLADLLLSLAWQMASLNSQIRQELLLAQQDGEVYDKCDERSIWKTMFTSRILRAELRRPHFWVIDALDECTNRNDVLPLLSKIDRHFPLKVFVTCRPSAVLERPLGQEKSAAVFEQIDRVDSLRDIQMYLEAHSHLLPVEDEAASRDLVNKILEKSSGNFLWASLVLKELETTHSDSQIQDVLESVPTEMDDLYARILNNLTANQRNLSLAKAILKWTVCASRPLTADELKDALRLDINETLPRLEKTAGLICGNLVYVDSQKRVQMVHQTVRAYLVREGLQTELAIVRSTAHSRLAQVCLEYLCSDELKTPRHRRGSTTSRPSKRSIFADYATVYFSEHMARSSSSIDGPLVALDSFLGSNSLTWIEMVATNLDLHPLTQTAKNLKTYLDRRAKYRSPLGQEVSNVSAWASDLIHLVAQFGKALLASPGSIHFLIPCVCPPGSIVYKTFNEYPRNLQLVGLSQTEWNDQLSCIKFNKIQALSLASSTSHFAIGLSDGSCRVCLETTLQEQLSLSHGEPVRQLSFAATGSYIAVAGRKKISLWELPSGQKVWELSASDHILALHFNEDDTVLMTTTRSNTMVSFSVKNGNTEDVCQFSDVFEDEQSNHHYQRPPTATVFSTSLKLLAVAYRGRPVSFWDLEDNSFVGQLERGQLSVVDILFNPNADANIAAAAYQDGTVVVFDPWTQRSLAESKAGASVLATTPDGNVIACGNGYGIITLLDFETLRVLYRLDSLEQNIRSIVFSSSGLRFFDIRGDRCSVWEPSVLVRRNDTGDDSSLGFSEEVGCGPELATTRASDEDLDITVMVGHHNGETIFCGREDGSVAAYASKSGLICQELFSHGKNVGITLLEWNQPTNTLGSVDLSGSLFVQKVSSTSSGSFVLSEPLLCHKSALPVHQILFSPDGRRLLISTAESDEIWNLSTTAVAETRSSTKPRDSWRWSVHPQARQQVLLVEGSYARSYDWDGFKEVTNEAGIHLGPSLPSASPVITISDAHRARNFCINYSGSLAVRSGATPALRFWPVANLFAMSSQKCSPVAEYDDLAREIQVIVGVYRNLLLFLHSSGWLCSIDIDKAGVEGRSYTKHFFIPSQLQGTSGKFAMLVVGRGSIAMAVDDQIAVFHNGLEFEEQVALDGGVLPSARLSVRSMLKRGSSAPK